MDQSLTPKYLFYKPRQTLYEVLFPIKIKDHTTSSWLDGYCYREAGKPNSQVYARPLYKFDDRWEMYNS